MGLDFKEIQYVCTKVPEEGELCKEIYLVEERLIIVNIRWGRILKEVT